MSKSTLGPWHVGPEYVGGWPIYLADDRHFCTVRRGPNIPAKYFAGLIAEAPAMLAGLCELRGMSISAACVDKIDAILARIDGKG